MSILEREAKRTDVFVGAAPRSKEDGSKEGVQKVWTLWADCDSKESSDLLAEFTPEPRYVVASGGPDHVQAWWPLKVAISPETAERLNRRLAHALKADPRVADCARMMRAPGTLNRKPHPGHPNAVRELLSVPGFVDPSLIDALPAPSVKTLERRGALPPRQSDETDLLLSVLPEHYVRALIGRTPDRGRKVTCPFHRSEETGGQERTPSLHVFHKAGREKGSGWWCFGCGEGGDIYDFAAKLWGLSTRGDDFRELKRRLEEEIGS